MYKSIVVASENATALIPKNGSKDTGSRLRKFASYLDNNHMQWLSPNLVDYRDYLLASGLSKSSTAAHLSTIRSAYQRILVDNATRDKLYFMAGDCDIVTKKMFVDEAMTRLSNEIDPKKSSVKITTKQDIVDSEHIRLTKEQALVLINAPDITTLHGIRDRAMISLALCTGLREAELCAINVDDLYQTYQSQPCLLIKKGKGDKQRAILFGGLKDFCLSYVEEWLNKANIKSGAVFRAINQSETKVNTERLVPRSVQNILALYPIVINGELTTVKPHDLRRSYAKLCFDNGMRLESIQANLGHSSTKTTLMYIGDLESEMRMPPSIF